ncbi:MAG: bifunctional phosphoribosyl-AMP cyclohydrolase/phosphoribosyl-ATP diphosphatase HisIE [Candidatus Tyrphobacter sp.]
MDLAGLKFDDRGLLPVIVSDACTGDVLTLAWANRDALERTAQTREAHLFSRSRERLWRKGEESGNVQHVVEMVADCDGDAVLYRVDPSGPACHTGERSCFHATLLERERDCVAGDFLRAVAYLQRVLHERKTSAPAGSYVATLYAGGVDRIGKKIGEEATEVVIAAKNAADDPVVWEAADLLFHLFVLLQARNISIDRVGAHLLERAR